VFVIKVTSNKKAVARVRATAFLAVRLRALHPEAGEQMMLIMAMQQMDCISECVTLKECGSEKQ
jgi:hypothetical protein